MHPGLGLGLGLYTVVSSFTSTSESSAGDRGKGEICRESERESSDGGDRQDSEGCAVSRLCTRLCCTLEAVWKGQLFKLLELKSVSCKDEREFFGSFKIVFL
jgi:hypothetical protein